MKKFLLLVLILCVSMLSVDAAQPEAAPVDATNIQGSRGYIGTLPDVLDKFQTSSPAESSPIFEAQEGFTDPDELSPAPLDNPTFVNIMLNNDKKMPYLEDIYRIIPLVEQLIMGIEDEIPSQIFIAKADLLSLNIDALRRKYKNKAESSYISYVKLMPLGVHAKSIATLRQEANQYNKYLAYQSTGSTYSPENVTQQLNYLLEELEDVLVILKQVD